MEQRINPLHANSSGGRQAQRNPGAPGQRTSNQASSAGQAGRTIGSHSNYGITRSPSALHVGDVIRGEITDLRNNEIAITLEDNTTIRAFIADSSSFSIGQTGSFRLSQISGGTLYLENISVGYSDTELAMIIKALDEAGLPATDYNKSAVKALMDNLLPINRSSIQNLMQQAYDYHTEDMDTLAIMKRLMMKVDSESVTQFSNYRNDNYQLLSRIENFSKDIPALLHALSDNSPSEAVASFGRELLGIGLSETISSSPAATAPTIAELPEQVRHDLMEMLSFTPLTEDTLAQLEEHTLPLQDAVTILRDAASNGTIKIPQNVSPETFAEQLNHLSEVLEPASGSSPEITEDFVRHIISLQTPEENSDSVPQNAAGSEIPQETAAQTSANMAPDDVSASKDAKHPEAAGNGTKQNGAILEESTASIKNNTETMEPKENRTSKASNPLFAAGRFFQSLSNNAKNTLSETFQSFRVPKEADTLAESFTMPKTNASLEKITDTYEKYSHENDLLSNYLSKEERNELLNHLQNMPVSKSMLLKIASGEANTKDVLMVIQNTIGLSDSKEVKELFQTGSFEKLFARHLQSNWTLTPDQLKKDDISSFYNRMHEQLSGFRNLIQSTLSGSDSEGLSGFAKNMEDNINFMKTLNETFSYFQLPLKLPSQDAHGDLYVYTQKEHLKNHPDKNSVLLHLDMEHLGKIDIRIDRNKNDVLTNFSLNDDESVNLFRVNQNMLTDALANEGYRCQVQITKKEAPSPTMDDFINTKVNTHATTEMKRFSFDIRA